MPNTAIDAILKQTRTIAVVGLSPNPLRVSYEVAQYLQNQGYRIIPVNPNAAGQSILGEPCFATLQEAAEALNRQGQKIDLVDCFRKSEDIPPIAQDAIAIQAKTLWLQLGIRHPAAENQARAAGLQVVADRCTKIEHPRMIKNA